MYCCQHTFIHSRFGFEQTYTPSCDMRVCVRELTGVRFCLCTYWPYWYIFFIFTKSYVYVYDELTPALMVLYGDSIFNDNPYTLHPCCFYINICNVEFLAAVREIIAFKRFFFVHRIWIADGKWSVWSADAVSFRTAEISTDISKVSLWLAFLSQEVTLFTRVNNSNLTTTPWHGNVFRVTGPLWRESTGDLWIPLTKGPVMASFDVRTSCWAYSRSPVGLMRHYIHVMSL